MKLSIKDIAKYEIIGLYAEVADSKNISNIGICGKIIDETKNTIIIECKGKKKRIFKDNVILKIKFGKQPIIIKGSLLAGNPKERIKNGKNKNH